MKQIIALLIVVVVVVACGKKFEPLNVGQDQIATFTSSDESLKKSYDWARNMALSYSHDNTDSVGYWYEAALPAREAFCMRDVSHQTIGGEIIGLTNHNHNMMLRFAQNITPEKDWCTYWEINRNNEPASVDYRNDKEFWYNLNANFDVVNAIWRLYQWSGNEEYIQDSTFMNFVDRSLNEYVERWDLQPEKMMSRQRFMNSPEPFDEKDSFHVCRGLPSYVENFPGIITSADLIATIYGGYEAASKMAAVQGDAQKSQRYADLSIQYKTMLNSQWWSAQDNSFRNFLTDKGEFHMGEGCTFVLWFNATDVPERITSTLASLIDTPTNVENMSYFPAILYRHNYATDAYDMLMTMPYMNRAEYPEVSYGVVEGVIGGMMGLKPDFSQKRITTMPNLISKTEWVQIDNVPVFGGFINLKHNSNSSSEFVNNIDKDIIWRAAFMGDASVMEVNGKHVDTQKSQDALGNTYIYADVALEPGERAICTIK